MKITQLIFPSRISLGSQSVIACDPSRRPFLKWTIEDKGSAYLVRSPCRTKGYLFGKAACHAFVEFEKEPEGKKGKR